MKFDDYLTTQEVALIFGVDDQTVRKWCQARQIARIKDRNRWYISIVDIDDMPGLDNFKRRKPGRPKGWRSG